MDGATAFSTAVDDVLQYGEDVRVRCRIVREAREIRGAKFVHPRIIIVSFENEQWEKLLDRNEEIRTFMVDNASKLKLKES